MTYKKVLAKIVNKYDLTSESQKKIAYKECLDYANEHYSSSLQINPFLKEAADALGQQHVVIDAIYQMTPSDGTEKVTLTYHEDNGPTLSANKSGLEFLAKTLSNLSRSKMAGEHVHLWGNKFPMTGNTFPLTIYYVEDNWFKTEEESETEPEEQEKEAESKIPVRDILAEDVAGVVFTKALPPQILLTPLHFYKAIGTEKYTSQKVWSKCVRNNTDRMHVLTLLDDADTEMSIAVDLDDDELFFLSLKDLESTSSSIQPTGYTCPKNGR